MDSSGWDKRYSTKDLVWTGRANQFVEQHLADIEPGSAIDLGAGEGRNSVWLAKRGWKVTAVDFSQVGLDKALQLAADNDVEISIECADATTFEAPDDVDLVILSYLQVGQEDQQKILEHAATWLRPGGTLFVIAHDRSNITDGYGGPPVPEVCYTVAETTDAIEGLEVSTAEVAERQVETGEGTRTALDTLVIARRPL
ncbi:MAG: class I SAM-dependent methyltransferase [Actinobacteria bacterium]|nr:MAG: class I SAM-dependent methyltransferase [Actinomycetota bacterium]